jgi:hypothetical protein
MDAWLPLNPPMKPSLAAKPSPKKTLTLESVARSVEELALRRARARRLAVLALAGALCLAGWSLGEARRAREAAQGAQEAGRAIAAARGALGIWSPQRGYGPLNGRELRSQTEWGALTTQRPLGDGSGMQIEYAFATQTQCQSLLEAAQAYFERAAVDGKPADSGAPGSSCSRLGQNAMMLIKLDPRPRGLTLQAGARSEIPGGVVPQRASPATREQAARVQPGALTALPPLSEQPPGATRRP